MLSDPRRREPRARAARRRLRQGARAVRARARTGGRLHRAEQQGRAGDRRASRRARPEPQRLPAVPRTARAGDGTPRPLRRPDDARVHETSTWRRRASTRPSRTCPRSPTARRSVLQEPRQDLEASGPALVGDASRCSTRLEGARHRGQAVHRQPLAAALEPPRNAAASSACSTSSSSAPAPPTATTRSGTSCAPRASARGCLKYFIAPAPGCSRKLFSTGETPAHRDAKPASPQTATAS